MKTKKSKKTLLKISLAVALGLSAFALINPTTSKAENKLAKKIEIKEIKDKGAMMLDKIANLPIMKKARLKPLKVIETNGIYYVMFTTPKGQTASVYITGDLKLMIHSGQGISTETGVPFTPPKDISTLKGQELFTYGTGKETLYIFTDPECPYCKVFEKTWKDVDLKDKYTFKVFIYPLSFHKQAPEMTHWILSAKTDNEKAKRLLEIANGSTEYKGYMKKETVDQYKKIEKQLNKVKQIAAQNSITGTPTVLNKEGKAVDWQTLAK